MCLRDRVLIWRFFFFSLECCRNCRESENVVLSNAARGHYEGWKTAVGFELCHCWPCDGMSRNLDFTYFSMNEMRIFCNVWHMAVGVSVLLLCARPCVCEVRVWKTRF